jgi:hypothetical protein
MFDERLYTEISDINGFMDLKTAINLNNMTDHREHQNKDKKGQTVQRTEKKSTCIQYRRESHVIPVVIDQFESLYKLDGCESFDLILLDEIFSVLDQAVSKETDDILASLVNWLIVKALLESTKSVLMIDSDILFKYFANQMFPSDWTMDTYTHVTVPLQIGVVTEQLIAEAIQKPQKKR